MLLAPLEQGREKEKADGDADEGVGDIETGEMVDAPVEIEHVDHIAAEKTVDYIADDPRVEKRLSYRSEVWKVKIERLFQMRNARAMRPKTASGQTWPWNIPQAQPRFST